MQNSSRPRLGYREEPSVGVEHARVRVPCRVRERACEVLGSERVSVRHTPYSLGVQRDPGHVREKGVERDESCLGHGSLRGELGQRNRVLDTEASRARPPQRFEVRPAP